MCHGTMGAGHARIKGAQIVNSADGLGQIDMTSIYGRGAARLPDGEIVWHLGDRLLRDGAELPLNGQEQVWLAEPPVRLTDSAGDREILAARDAVMDYRWHTDDDGRRFLGWLVCALVGGALDWRPHLLLTAPAGQGKSWLLKKVIEPLYGPLLLRIADGTEASVARATQASSLPLVVDEAEPSSGWVMKLMTLLRVAAGGEGKRLRSDLGSSSGVTFQNPRFSALLSATSVPVMSAADSTRISLCNLGHAVSDWGAVSRGIETAMAQGGRIRSRLIRDTPAIVGKAKAITDRLIVERAGSSNRQPLIEGALTAGWWWWSGGRDEAVVPSQSSRPEAHDATDALHEILAIGHRTTANYEASILQCLAKAGEAPRIEDLYGIRLDEDDGILIATRHPGLTRQLRRSALGNTDLKRLLLQIPDTEYTQHPQRFGGRRYRAVRIGTDSLDQVGVGVPKGEPVRTCRDCPNDISARPNRAIYCLPCAAYRRRVRGNWVIGADPDRKQRKAIAAAAILYENGTKRPRVVSVCPERESGGVHDFADVSVRGVAVLTVAGRPHYRNLSLLRRNPLPREEPMNEPDRHESRNRWKPGPWNPARYTVHYAPRNRLLVLAWGRVVRALRRALRG